MPKILIVEDNDFIARMYENILHFEHYSVDIALNGEEGFTKAKMDHPDLILLDVIMPKMNGLETLEKLKADSETQRIPVVMLTVVGDDETIDKCFNLGASGYLIKSSLDPDQIISEVETYLSDKHSSSKTSEA